MTADIDIFKEDLDELVKLLVSIKGAAEQERYKTTIDSIGLLVELIKTNVGNSNLIEHKDYFDELRLKLGVEIKDVQKVAKEDLNLGDVKNYQIKLWTLKRLMRVRDSLPLCVRVEAVQNHTYSISEEIKKEMQKVADRIGNGKFSI